MSKNTLLYRLFPFLLWLKGYQPASLKNDAIAGLTVAAVLVPQSMAYAILAGLPPVYGLYASVGAPLIGALWGQPPPDGNRPYSHHEPSGAHNPEHHGRTG